MKKTILALALFAILIGCTQQQQPTSGQTFVGGTEGIRMEFLPDSPPSEVFDGGTFPFNVNVYVKNVGEWEIKSPSDLTVTLSGVDPADFSLSTASFKKDSSQQLAATKRGINGEILDGDSANIDFPGFNYKKTLFGDVPATIKADACYAYGTRAVSSVCIKKDISDKDTTICSVNSQRIVQNSGAPVQVVSLKEAPAGTDKVVLTLLIRHVGKGDVSKKSTECSNSIVNKDRVYISVDTGLAGLACSGLQSESGSSASGSSGYLTLFSGERQITCTQPTNGQGDFEKTVSITLEYDYNQFIIVPIKIKHV